LRGMSAVAFTHVDGHDDLLTGLATAFAPVRIPILTGPLSLTSPAHEIDPSHDVTAVRAARQRERTARSVAVG
jgi:hypothetical protein